MKKAIVILTLSTLPIVARLSPDNNVIKGLRAEAKATGFGQVSAVGFKRDCTPIPNKVVVCRDIALDATGRAELKVGRNYCVIRLDPRIGGGERGRRVMREVLLRCHRGLDARPTV